MTDKTNAGSVPATLATLDELCLVCAEAYQLAGAVGAPVEVLDNLSAAMRGYRPPHESFLPFSPDSCDEIKELTAKLAAAQLALKNERRMWKNAIDVVIRTPLNLRLIGNPGEPNEVRDALTPVAMAASLYSTYWGAPPITYAK